MTKQTSDFYLKKIEEIPFIDVILPYSRVFLKELEEQIPSISLLNKLQLALLQEMSQAAIVVLQKELDLL